MGILTDLMTALVELEETVHDDLRVYPIQPDGVPQLPALWNWFPDGTFDPVDTTHGDDTITIFARVGIRHVDATEDQVRLLTYADAFIETIDPALKTELIPGYNAEHRRTGMRARVVQFAEVPVLCFEFPIRVTLRRTIWT